MHRPVIALLALTIASAAEGRATAGPLAGFLDGSVGLSAPVADDRYDALVEAGPQVGVRAGALVQVHPAGAESDPRVVVGLDLGFDHTWMNLSDESDDTTLTRWRFTAGPRVALQFPHVELFARAGAGVERIHMDTTAILEMLCGDPTIQSAAFEGALGVGVTTGHLIVGAQLGAGVSDHGGDRPTCKPVGGQPVYVDVLDTRNVDLNAQLFVGVRL
ncbi:MAG: hypothetical protein K8W52_09005 [Deltaproteobacteria bacterium]|nr:hypothetical protein [Deltaproteobacteria bacterium]